MSGDVGKGRCDVSLNLDFTWQISTSRSQVARVLS